MKTEDLVSLLSTGAEAVDLRVPSRRWLLALVPDAIGHRSQLENQLRDPETVALLAAAPDALRRSLRSLCWMLFLAPPPILAHPARTKPPAAPAPAIQPPPPRPPPAAPAASEDLPLVPPSFTGVKVVAVTASSGVRSAKGSGR